MSGEAFTVNSEGTYKSFCEYVHRLWVEHKYLTFAKPRLGVDRSLSQNALMHLWLTELAAHLSGCHPKLVSEGMIEGIKRTTKGWFYRDTQSEWMLHAIRCPLTKREKKDFTSSAKWKQGEMFEFLTWLQALAAQHGCLLESKGEFLALNQKQFK
jgi:hypothetical protein